MILSRNVPYALGFKKRIPVLSLKVHFLNELNMRGWENPSVKVLYSLISYTFISLNHTFCNNVHNYVVKCP